MMCASLPIRLLGLLLPERGDVGAPDPLHLVRGRALVREVEPVGEGLNGADEVVVLGEIAGQVLFDLVAVGKE